MAGLAPAMTRSGASSARRPAVAKSLDFVRLCSGAAWMAGSSPAMTMGDRWHASDRSLPTANALSANIFFLIFTTHAILPSCRRAARAAASRRLWMVQQTTPDSPLRQDRSCRDGAMGGRCRRAGGFCLNRRRAARIHRANPPPRTARRLKRLKTAMGACSVELAWIRGWRHVGLGSAPRGLGPRRRPSVRIGPKRRRKPLKSWNPHPKAAGAAAGRGQAAPQVRNLAPKPLKRRGR
jgi:hypothetical protein